LYNVFRFLKGPITLENLAFIKDNGDMGKSGVEIILGPWARY
jgi:hypothetical protein